MVYVIQILALTAVLYCLSLRQDLSVHFISCVSGEWQILPKENDVTSLRFHLCVRYYSAGFIWGLFIAKERTKLYLLDSRLDKVKYDNLCVVGHSHTGFCFIKTNLWRSIGKFLLDNESEENPQADFILKICYMQECVCRLWIILCRPARYYVMHWA